MKIMMMSIQTQRLTCEVVPDSTETELDRAQAAYNEAVKRMQAESERTTDNDQKAADKAAKMEYLKREYRDCKAQLIAAF